MQMQAAGSQSAGAADPRTALPSNDRMTRSAGRCRRPPATKSAATARRNGDDDRTFSPSKSGKRCIFRYGPRRFYARIFGRRLGHLDRRGDAGLRVSGGSGPTHVPSARRGDGNKVGKADIAQGVTIDATHGWKVKAAALSAPECELFAPWSAQGDFAAKLTQRRCARSFKQMGASRRADGLPSFDELRAGAFGSFQPRLVKVVKAGG